MKLHKPFLAITKDNKLFVRGYAEPQPIEKEIWNGVRHEQTPQYDKWLQSQIDLSVRDESVEELLKLLLPDRPDNFDIFLLSDIIKRGINIDHLQGRLEVVEQCGECSFCRQDDSNYCAQIKLLPIKEGVSDKDELYNKAHVKEILLSYRNHAFCYGLQLNDFHEWVENNLI